ncbi:MAG TPA: tetratricopeptide repeat protein, partial [Tepidisphaeraceae bacterium]|nr:tetratricopeptide repeat protein [Tepidisphaeraceae bacterium]
MDQSGKSPAVRMLEEARAHFNAGRFPDAEKLCRQILASDPNEPAALHLLGKLAHRAARPDISAQLIGQSIQIDPNNALAHADLGEALMNLNRPEQAIPALRHAVELKTNFPEAYTNLGIALALRGELDASIAAFGNAIAQRPSLPEAHDGLGMSLRISGQPEQAVAAHRKAIKLRASFASAHANLALALIEIGQTDEAIASLRQAIQIAPHYRDAHTSLVYHLHFQTPYDAEAIYREHLAWNKSFAQPLAQLRKPHHNDRNPDRPLRVGYVSPDFRTHSVAYFIETLLAGHNRDQVEVFCYADLHKRDEVTTRLQSYVANWREISGRNDDEVERMIRNDKIDILVDLAGHTGGNRLLLFARKPAPIQVSYLGYIDTTGSDAIDYRMTDVIADPPDQAGQFYSERLLWLAKTFACYQPPANAPAVGPLPAETNRSITFASFAGPHKINPPLLETWASVLARVPDSRLMIVAAGLRYPTVQESIHRIFDQRGIARDRLTLLDQQSFGEYLALHNRVDVVLDSFPVTGHTVTCHALWMGVPVVTLAGSTYCQRLSASVLTNLGLQELIAQSPEQYIEIAAKLTMDLPGLAKLRSGLRQKMSDSVVTDAKSFVLDVEDAYRMIWREWCETAPAAVQTSFAASATNTQALIDAIIKLASASRFDEAIAGCRDLLAATPDHPQAHFMLGTLLIVKGQTDSAITELNQAIALRPDFPEAHNNLGNALLSQGKIDQAIVHFKKYQALQPASAEAHRNLGGALVLRGDFDAAFTALDQALALNPNDVEAHIQLASAFKGIGDIEQAIARYDRALAIQPNHLLAASNRLFALNFRHDFSGEQILEEHRRWNDRFARPLLRQNRPHRNDASPERQLRIGYVSPDFQDHVLGINLLPLFAHHDHSQFQVTCYSNSPRTDAVTERFRSYADEWRNIVGHRDADVAELIERDQIDILVDLTLHSRDNRLLVFARKPAPVQFTFAGYPGTTGLEAIDYRLTDPYLDPLGSNDGFYSEQSIRLPHSFWCYQPMSDQPWVNALPALSSGKITLGCLCSFAKVNSAMLGCWGRILKAMPNSKLLMMAPCG